MKLFAIQVPTNEPRDAFEDFIKVETGGFSVRNVTGFWRDGKTGKDYSETMAEYHIACDPALMFDIQAKAFCLFPNEVCFFVAEIGTASLVYPVRAEGREVLVTA